MKKITFLFLFTSFVISGKAQDTIQEVDNEFEEMVDSLYGLLDTTHITSGYHADRGIFFYHQKLFNGQSNCARLEHYGMFKSFVAGIFTSSISKFHLPVHYDDWEEGLENTFLTGEIPLLFMHYHYQQFLEDSLELFQYIEWNNGRFQDVANSGDSAYTTESLVAMAAYENKIFDTLSAVFSLPSDFVTGNTGKTIQQLEMDWDNGLGYQTFTLNEDISVEWLDFGEKTVTLKVTYTDASVVNAKFKFSLIDTYENSGTEKLANGAPGYDAIPDERIYIQSDRNQNLGAVMEIEYGCGNHAITKPLIVVEGFNPAEFHNNSRGLVYANFFRQIENFEDNNSSQFPLFTQLQEEGYDIIYIDFDQGAGDMRENAYLVMAVIDWVNEQKANNNSEEANVLLGMSMGGVVGRLALLYMEDETPNTHDVSQYISFDSPHLGANVPISIQFMVEHLYYSQRRIFNRIIRLRDYFPEINNAGKVLRHEGTKQLLRYSTVKARLDHSNNRIFRYPPANYVTNGSELTSTIHLSLINELNNLGMPQETEENIGIANGNNNGVNQGFQPLDELFNANCAGNDCYDLVLFQLFDTIDVITNVQYDLNTLALPNHSNNEQLIYSGELIVGGLPITRRFNLKVKNVMPYDNSPAGSYYISSFGLNQIPFDPNTINIAEKFSFIPTTSALNIQSEINNPHFTFNLALLVSNSQTNFDAVYVADPTTYSGPFAAPNNEPHTNFTPSNISAFESSMFPPVINDINSTPTIVSETFNFGRNDASGETTTNRASQSINISGTTNNKGVACVNCDDRIGIVSNQNNPTATTDDFTMFITQGCDQGGITISSHGELIIGHDANKTGLVYIRRDAFLKIEDGGRLIIRENSKLIVEAGGNFEFLENAQIILDGPNSILEIRGKVTIGDNATFTFSGNGRIIMDQGIYPAVFDDFWDIGQNAKFEIEGSFPYDQVMLEVKRNFSPKMSSIYNHHTFENVKLWGCKILIHPGKHISIPGAAHLHHLDVDLPLGAGANDKHDGFMLWGDFNSQT